MTETVDTRELFDHLDETWHALMNLVSSVPETLVNKVPFAGSWTVAQLATHVTKSNNAIAQGLDMKGTAAKRPADEGVLRLRKMFLNFDTKFQSPEFITPENKEYSKEEVITHLENSIARLKNRRITADLCEVINMKVFSEITKLELLHFVLYHTQRHIHQLKNIIQKIEEKKTAE
ncbi:MAG TPA: DinB family protein [Chitinophagaceae bacterium]|nr:DinB family protein [Chitinophagaceae bacterium]